MEKLATSVVIGGADGPTSVFLAGKVGGELSVSTILIGVAIVFGVIAVVQIIKERRKK